MRAVRLVSPAAVAVTVVLLLVATADAAAGTRVIAIIAGNNAGTADDAALEFAEHDAEALAAVLRKLSGVAAHDAVLLLGDQAEDLRNALLQTNVRLRSPLRDPGQDVTILITYYSGHAGPDGLHMSGTVLPFEELKALVAGSAASVRVLIVDACRSGGITRVKGARAAAPFDIAMEDRITAEGLAIITSSTAGENSYESQSLRGSFFTHHLVSGLRGAADTDRDRRVTLAELYDYAYRQTLQSSGSTSSLQHPTFLYEIKGRGELAIARLDRDVERMATLQIASPGRYLLRDRAEDGPIAAEVEISEKGADIVLPAGEYFVQHRGKAAFREYGVALNSRAAVALEKLPFREVTYARLLRKGGGERRAVHGFYALAAGRGETLDREGPTAHAVLGYSLDLPWLTWGGRFRYADRKSTLAGASLEQRHTELAFGLTAQRYVDLNRISLALGLSAEAVRHEQRFSGPGRAPARAAWGSAFGGLLGVELQLAPRLVARVELGPMTTTFTRAIIDNGAPAGSETASVFTWWLATGFGWRF
ncbi:MAG: caspase family protein [Candidatus Schekmanbacteria bacterium]|nr:caspase family protein [Candidatus Schekmanbacteria bacterium]